MLHPDPGWRWLTHGTPIQAVILSQVRKTQHCQTQISNLTPSKIFPLPPFVLISRPFKTSAFLSGVTSHDSAAAFLPFFGVQFYLDSDVHFDIWYFLLKCETQRQRTAASSWSPSVYHTFHNKISPRHTDSQGPNRTFLPAFLIFLPKRLMAEASAFSTNHFLFSNISAILGYRGRIHWTQMPDSCENCNGCSHQKDVQVMSCSRMPCWRVHGGTNPSAICGSRAAEG